MQDALDKLAAMEKQTRNVGRPSYRVFSSIRLTLRLPSLFFHLNTRLRI